MNKEKRQVPNTIGSLWTPALFNYSELIAARRAREYEGAVVNEIRVHVTQKSVVGEKKALDPREF